MCSGLAEKKAKTMPSSSMINILASTFFVVAATWLIIAILYSVSVVCFLRLRSRGDLGSVYHPNFGRVYLFGTSWCYLPMGFIFRRFVVHYRTEGGRNAVSDIHIMKREERRAAMEVVLGDKVHEIERRVDVETLEPITETEEAPDRDVGDDFSNATEPMCSICLGEYEDDDLVLSAKTCCHKFHRDCILDWLERQNNTDCPCCRSQMVSEDEVWRLVREMRKETRSSQTL